MVVFELALTEWFSKLWQAVHSQLFLQLIWSGFDPVEVLVAQVTPAAVASLFAVRDCKIIIIIYFLGMLLISFFSVYSL